MAAGLGNGNGLAVARLDQADIDLGIFGVLGVGVGIKLQRRQGIIFDRQLAAGLDGYGVRTETVVGIGNGTASRGRLGAGGLVIRAARGLAPGLARIIVRV